jgi:putative endonuclease
MYFVYVLRSLKDGKFYTGYTENVDRRLTGHNSGKNTSTKYRCPFEIVYYEACRNQRDALRREKYLKTTYGKRYIKNRIHYDLDT